MSVEVQDLAAVLGPGQQAALESTATPHRVKVLLANPAGKEALKIAIHDCVDTPNTLCIGVSPKLRFTWTEIGIDTGIKSGDYQQVGRAGNLDFKEARWADGVQAIISRAQVLAHKETVVPTGVLVQEHKTVVDHGVSPWPFVIGFGALGLIVGGVWWSIRKQQKRTARVLENFERETAEMAARNLREDPKWQKTPTAPAPAKPINEQKTKATKPSRKIVEMSRPVVVNQVVPFPEPVFVPAPVMPAPYVPPAPTYSPPPRMRTPAPAPRYSRPKDDTPAPSRRTDSGGGGFFDSFSGGGGGGGFDGGGGFSGGGGGGDF